MWAVSPHPISELLHAYIPGLVHQGPGTSCSWRYGVLNRSWKRTSTSWLLLPNVGPSCCCWLDQLRLLANPPSHPTLLTQYDTLLFCFIAILCLFCVLDSFKCAVSSMVLLKHFIYIYYCIYYLFGSQPWWHTIMAKGFDNREISFLERVCVDQL